MSNRKLTRMLTISMAIPHTYKRQSIAIPANRNVVKECAAAIQAFATRNGVHTSYVEYTTQWGV